MAFDLAWNCRDTSDFVTDQNYAVPLLNETYPHTYTNSNGDSINAGWSTGPQGKANIAGSNDSRIAGMNFQGNGTAIDLTVDLSSGSAPGAGTYTIDLALGTAGSSFTQSAKVLDNSTMLIDLTNGGAGYTPANDHFLDATVADVAATSSWTGTTVSKTFASTTAIMRIGVAGPASYTTLAHFRLTLTGGGGGGSVVPVLMAQYRQRRN